MRKVEEGRGRGGEGEGKGRGGEGEGRGKGEKEGHEHSGSVCMYVNCEGGGATPSYASPLFMPPSPILSLFLWEKGGRGGMRRVREWEELLLTPPPTVPSLFL